MADEYLNFDVSLELVGDRYRLRVDSPVGATTGDFILPFSDIELENFVLRMNRVKRTVRRVESPEIAAAKSFGGRLFDALFGDEVRACLSSSLNQASHEGKGLRLRLRLTGVPELADIPWEYLYHPALNRFFALSVDTPIVRSLDLLDPGPPLPVQLPLRVLVMISSPHDYVALDGEAEWERLRSALGALEARGLVVVERLEQATLAALQRQVRRQAYHIFHFVGHGGFNEQAQDGVLVLSDEQGRGRPIGGQELGALLHDERSLRLVVLNACEGARASRTDPFAGVAQSLIQQGIPAVIAMQFEISDEAAIVFAQEFYGALTDGYLVDGALAEARKAIFAQNNDVEWGVPVLYLRGEQGQLFDIQSAPEPEAQQGVTSPVPESKGVAPAEATDSPLALKLPPLRILLSGTVFLLVLLIALVVGLLMRPSPAPTVRSFTVQPDQMVRGESEEVVITWEVDGAESVTILASTSGEIVGEGTSGTVRLPAPDVTERFVLTAWGAEQERTETRVVQVTEPLVVASPTPPLCPRVGGPFAEAWTRLRGELGCVTGEVTRGPVREGEFAAGQMFVREGLDSERVLTAYQAGEWEFLDSASLRPVISDYACTDDETPERCPPTPKEEFGQIWCGVPGVRVRLGNALTCERDYEGVMQSFERGFLLRADNGYTYAFFNDGRWEALAREGAMDPALCPSPPMTPFKAFWQGSRAVHSMLGCPSVADGSFAGDVTLQRFPNGWLYEFDTFRYLYVLLEEGTNHTWQLFSDRDLSVATVSYGCAPDTFTPTGNFAALLAAQPDIAEELGWCAITEAERDRGSLQFFDNGAMLLSPSEDYMGGLTMWALGGDQAGSYLVGERSMPYRDGSFRR